MSSVAELLCDYVNGCPAWAAAGCGPLLLDSPTPGQAALATGETKALKVFFDGSELQRRQFVLYAQSLAGDGQGRASGYRLLEQAADWLLAQNQAGGLPDLGSGCVVLRLEIGVPGLERLLADGSGVYALPFRLVLVRR